MKTNIFTRFITVLTFLIAQLSMPCLSLLLFLMLLIYLLNLFVIQPDKLKYLNETYLYIIITLILTIIFSYISLIGVLLNFLKFGRADLVSKIIAIPRLLTTETKLYYYNLTGQSSKAIDIAKGMVLTDKMILTKLLVSDAFYIAKKYKTALKLVSEESNAKEIDLAMAKRALIIAKKDNDFDKAIELACDAININKNNVVRNSEVKYFEISLILSEIYYLAGELEKTIETLEPWYESITKYPIFFKSKYNAYFMSQYFLLYAQTLLKKNIDIEKVKYLLDKTIITFPASLPAKEAYKIKIDLFGSVMNLKGS